MMHVVTLQDGGTSWCNFFDAPQYIGTMFRFSAQITIFPARDDRGPKYP